MLMLAILVAPMWAQRVKIGGVNYTTTGNISNSAVTGSVHFDASNRVLTLKNATITVSDNDAVFVTGFTDGLTIRCEGSNTIICSEPTSSSCAGIYGQSKIWIGSASGQVGSLTVKNTGAGNAIRMEPNYRLDISGIHFTAETSNNDCLSGYSDNNIFAPNFTWMSLKAPTGKAAMSGFNAIYTNLNGVQQSFVSTVGCSFSSSKGGIVDASGNLVNKANVAPALVIGQKPIVVGNDQSYSSSSSDASLMGLTSGTIKWDHSTKTLTMNGVTLSKGIVSYLSSFKINSTGSENLIKASSIPLDIYGSTEITGDKKITFENTNGSAVYMNKGWKCPLTVNVDATAKFTGSSRGVYNDYSESAPNNDLILKKAGSNSDYYFYGGSQASIIGVCHLTLTDMDFFYDSSYGTPGCYWDASSRQVKKTGGEVVKGSDVNFYVIKNEYPISIAGVKLNNCNHLAVGSPYITSGTVNYNTSSKTLTLDNVTMNVTEDNVYGIHTTSTSADAELTVKLVGTNKITTKGTCVGANKDITFTGDGGMTMTSTNGYGISCMGACSKLTIDNTRHFLVDAKSFALYGTQNELYLKKATSDRNGFRFTNTGGGAAIYNISKLTLDNMDFFASDGDASYSAGCYFDETDKRVEVNGGQVAKSVSFHSIKQKLPIYICGKQLNVVYEYTSEPYGTDIIEVGSKYITGGGAKAVCYDPSTKTLTLNNAKIDYTTASNTNDGIITTKQGTELTITANGINNLSSTTAFGGLWLDYSKVTINGNGTLNLAGKTDDLYGLNSTVLKVEGDVTLEALNKGIGSNNDMGEMIVGGNAVVKAKHISYLRSLTLEDGHAIVEPMGATFSDKAVRVGSTLAQDVMIMKVEEYGLKVADMAVNSYNCSDILGDGKFAYDNEAKTLTITGATIDNTDISDVVYNQKVDGLKINVQGENNFKVNDNIFQLDKNTTITGTGSIKGELKAYDGFGIYLPTDGVTVTLDGLTFEFTGDRAVGGSGSDLVINSGKLIFNPNSSSDATALSVKSLTLGEGMYITQPDGAVFENKRITLNGEVYRGKVVIEGATAYDLWIAEKAVNSVNCNNILGDGVFAYDVASNTLTIKGNHTYTSDDYLVKSAIADLTINVAGNSMLVSAADNTIIRLYANTTITGGKLTLMCTAPSNDGLGIYISDGGILTLKDADIDVTGDGFTYGITGDSSSKLVIDNSNISASAHSYGAIYDWGGITLTNCYVETPRPSTVDEMGISDADGYVGSGDETATVVIKAGADAIDGIEAAETAPAEIYDVAGRKLDQTRRGINIVRTKNGKAVKVIRK
jgi:hypothetical protein